MGNVEVEITEGVARITLNRPPVNALDRDTFLELADAFESLGTTREANVAVLASAHATVFCAGVDLKDSARRHRTDGRDDDGGPKGDARDQIDAGRVPRRCFWSIYDCAVPVIAELGGKAIGAGAMLVACSDLVVASDEGSLALTEINVGVLGGVKAVQRMVGPYLAKRMLLTGEFVGAAELYRRGGVEAVVEAERLRDTGDELARTIASKSPIAIRLAKESANRVEYLDLRDGYRLEQDYTTRVRRFADADEASRAFLDHRDPEFRWE